MERGTSEVPLHDKNKRKKENGSEPATSTFTQMQEGIVTIYCPNCDAAQSIELDLLWKKDIHGRFVSANELRHTI